MNRNTLLPGQPERRGRRRVTTAQRDANSLSEYRPARQQEAIIRTMRSVPVSLLFTLLAVTSTACGDAFDNEGLIHCEQAIEAQFPAPATPNTFAGSWIVIDLHCPVSAPILRIQTPDGQPWELPTQLKQDGRQVRALPSVPLEPETRFIVEFDDGSFSKSWLLTTSSLGSPIEYPLSKHSEELLIDEGQLLSPASIAGELLDRLHPVRPVIEFLGEPTASTITGRLGALMSETDLQDTNWQTVDRTFNWQMPYFNFGPLDLRWPLEGWALVLEQTIFRGAPHPVLGGIGAVNIEALWDTREADVMLGGSVGALCAYTLENDGVGCVPCSDGSESCLDLLLLDVPTQLWTDELQQVL